MATLGAPRNVSSLIRTGRWVALALGLGYGYVHNNSLLKKEAVFQEGQSVLRAKRDARLALEREAGAKNEMRNLAIQSGVDPKDVGA